MKNNINNKSIFSYFKAPVTNTTPYNSITLNDAFKVITGEYYKSQTHQLRSITDKNQNREYKATNFPYATFSGIFKTRRESSLIQHSGLIAIDFDGLENVEVTKFSLLKRSLF